MNNKQIPPDCNWKCELLCKNVLNTPISLTNQIITLNNIKHTDCYVKCIDNCIITKKF